MRKSNSTKKSQKKTKTLSRKKTSFVKASCAPTAEKKEYTCYSDNALTKMKNLWNARHPDSKIMSDDKREIWNHLKTNLQEVCDSENCWLKQEFITNNLDSRTYC
jgi:hypothetical protein